MKVELKQRLIGGGIIIIAAITLLPFFILHQSNSKKNANNNIDIAKNQQPLQIKSESENMASASSGNAEVTENTEHTENTENNDATFLISPREMKEDREKMNSMQEADNYNTYNNLDSNQQVDQTQASNDNNIPNSNAQQMTSEQTSDNNTSIVSNQPLNTEQASAENEIINSQQSQPAQASTQSDLAVNSSVNSEANAKPVNDLSVSQTSTSISSVKSIDSIKNDKNKGYASALAQGVVGVNHAASSSLNKMTSSPNLESGTGITAGKVYSASEVSNNNIPAIAKTGVKTTEANASVNQNNLETTSLSPQAELSSQWIVQIGSYAQEANAARMLDQLHREGLAAYSDISYLSNGQKIIRVFAGPFSQARAEEIKRERFIDGIVKKRNV